MIKIDSMEPEKIFRYAEQYTFEKERLPIGDFCNNEKSFVVERKTIEDLISSLRSGHLQKQLLQMCENYEHPYLIISGNFNKSYFDKVITLSLNQWIGMLASLGVRYSGLKILQIENDKQLVDLVFKLDSKINDGKVVTIRETELLKSKVTEEDRAVHILTCFPKIGVKRAQKLMETNPEVNMYVKQLIQWFKDYKNKS